jgi:predicted aldo/keto reductase-like oxidoreductase
MGGVVGVLPGTSLGSECVAGCPAGIDIPERMKEAIKAFGRRQG